MSPNQSSDGVKSSQSYEDPMIRSGECFFGPRFNVNKKGANGFDVGLTKLSSGQSLPGRAQENGDVEDEVWESTAVDPVDVTDREDEFEVREDNGDEEVKALEVDEGNPADQLRF